MFQGFSVSIQPLCVYIYMCVCVYSWVYQTADITHLICLKLVQLYLAKSAWKHYFLFELIFSSLLKLTLLYFDIGLWNVTFFFIK